jgi:hypothetical protein
VIQGGVIGGRRPPDRKEHFLKDFLGFRPIADDAGDQREQQAVTRSRSVMSARVCSGSDGARRWMLTDRFVEVTTE